MHKIQVPPDRPFPPGHLEARRNHLVREARAEVGSRHGSRFLRIATVPRAIAIGALLLAVGAGAFVSVGHLDGGTGLAAAAVRINVSPTLPGSSIASSRAPRQVVVNVLKAAQTRSQQREDVVVSGGTSAEQDLLREILSSMPDSSITSASIVPKEYLGTTGVGLEFAVLPGDFPRSQWEEMLLAGAFRALSTERGLMPVVGLPPQDPNYSPSAETPADVEANITQAASDVGAEVVQIQIYQAHGIEPAVILKVDDPGPFLKDRLSTFLDAIHAYSHSYGALYAEIIDSNGAFAWGYGIDTLTSTSSVGTRPDFAGCNPVQVIGFGIQPPCPTS